MTDYTWTVQPDGLAHDLAFAVGLELAPIHDVNGETFERMDDSEGADLFSVYVRTKEGPAYVVADRNTYDDALAFADALAKRTGLPLDDLT